MKKVFLIIAIVFANAVFTSCTDLDEDLDNKPIESEISATDGEDGHIPEEEEEEDPANGG